jgi:hypothetical protein
MFRQAHSADIEFSTIRRIVQNSRGIVSKPNTSCSAVVAIAHRCSEFCLLDEFGAACDFR